MIHAHELTCRGNAGGWGVQGGSRKRVEKIWDKCSSIINKIYLKIELHAKIFRIK